MTSRWIEQAVPMSLLDDTLLATQLDGVVVAEGEERGSPSKTRGVPQGPRYSPRSPSERQILQRLCKEGSIRALSLPFRSRGSWQ